MKSWDQRAHEVAYLLNPAFCSRLIFASIKEYEVKAKHDFPFSLSYLVLPLVLHKQTRNRINSRTQLLNWIQSNQDLMIGFARRAKDLAVITNESLEFLLQTNMIEISQNGNIKTTSHQKALSKTRYVDNEITECIRKSEHVARWFASAGKVETIYVSLGVRP